MAIVVRCTCGNEWKAGDAALGRSMPCPRCQNVVVIGEVAAGPEGNARLKMALVLVAGAHLAARHEVFTALREGSLLVPVRAPTAAPTPADCFYRTGRSGSRALLAFTDPEELRLWPSARGAPVVLRSIRQLLELLNATGPNTALLINETSLLGLLLNHSDVDDLARGRDPDIADLREFVIAKPVR